jgi:hypothetical protein
MKTVYDLIRHRATLEVICGNCDHSRVFNHRFLAARFSPGSATWWEFTFTGAQGAA